MHSNKKGNWWDETVVFGLTRNDVLFFIIIAVIVAIDCGFINLDYVFGLRQ